MSVVAKKTPAKKKAPARSGAKKTPSKKRVSAKPKTVKRKRYRNQSVANPSLPSVGSVAVSAAIGLGSYGAVRVGSRIAFVTATRVAPRFARHAAGAGALAIALAIVFGTRYVGRAREHHLAASVPALIAALVTLLEQYAPSLSWIFAAPNANEYRQLPSGMPSAPRLPASSGREIPGQPAPVMVIGDEIIEASEMPEPEGELFDFPSDGFPDNLVQFGPIDSDLGDVG